jgi:cobalt-zinc-cadmium efflux system outer membrane protein
MFRRLLLLSALLLASGCAWPVQESTNQLVRDLADHPFDISPDRADVTTAALMESRSDSSARDQPLFDDRAQTTARIESRFMAPRQPVKPPGTLDVTIPRQVPGFEAPPIVLSRDPAVRQAEIERLYPELPPLPEEPRPQPGPGGNPYSLSGLQRLAAANSPLLRQAASDVEAARGNLIQAATYNNPTIAYLNLPTADNSSANFQSGFFDQVISTGGKMKLEVAAATKDLDNAELALKRARSDLATAVRRAYFTLLVDRETLIVTRSLVHFADEVYRVQIGLLKGTRAAAYEPASLRAQAFQMRLAYKQAIASYIYDWKQLGSTIGLDRLPLSELAGRVDRFIPYYEYDQVLAYAVRNHTDVLSARNTITQAQYNLKLAQVTPLVPDVDLHMPFGKDFSFAPPTIAPGTFGTFNFFSLSFQPPVWDWNKGNIIANQAGLILAGEQVHLAEMNLTSRLAVAYANYKNNLLAMEYYRRNILPDLVRYYRGIFARRQVDPASGFNDLVTAQQALTENVTNYLDVLDSLWSSVVSVADFLQTDDLFQLATPRVVPTLPDLSGLPALWACGHGTLAAACADHFGLSDCGTGAGGRAHSEPSRRVPGGRDPSSRGTAPPLEPP